MVRKVTSLRYWLDASAREPLAVDNPLRVDWLRTLPYVGMHLACLAVFWVGWSPIAVAVAVFLYAIRMFAITGFYHRYFSHRAFKTSRPLQFVFAVIGAASVQRGPIWWAAHHRQHHMSSETPEDPHSPVQLGFWRSHTGWFLTHEHFVTNEERVQDWLKFPELRFLDRFDIAVPVFLAVGLLLLGSWLETAAPGLGTSGGQMLVWGFFVSTVVLYHATFTINSLAHRWGKRRYATNDDSRNNWFLALITFGEGWHNNHHHYPVAARQGFYWWELDLTWYAIKAMEKLGLVWDVKAVPVAKRESNQLAPSGTRA